MIQFDGGDKWEGLDRLDEDIWEELKPRAFDAMMDAGVMAQSTVREMLSHPGTGRTYKVSKTGALHRASAPGEPPAVLHGHLRNSIGHSRPAWSGGEISLEYGPGLGVSASGEVETYSRRLEYGGADSRGVVILPRPYMEPSERALEPLLERLFEARI